VPAAEGEGWHGGAAGSGGEAGRQRGWAAWLAGGEAASSGKFFYATFLTKDFLPESFLVLGCKSFFT